MDVGCVSFAGPPGFEVAGVVEGPVARDLASGAATGSEIVSVVADGVVMVAGRTILMVRLSGVWDVALPVAGVPGLVVISADGLASCCCNRSEKLGDGASADEVAPGVEVAPPGTKGSAAAEEVPEEESILIGGGRGEIDGFSPWRRRGASGVQVGGLGRLGDGNGRGIKRRGGRAGRRHIGLGGIGRGGRSRGRGSLRGVCIRRRGERLRRGSVGCRRGGGCRGRGVGGGCGRA